MACQDLVNGRNKIRGHRCIRYDQVGLELDGFCDQGTAIDSRLCLLVLILLSSTLGTGNRDIALCAPRFFLAILF